MNKLILGLFGLFLMCAVNSEAASARGGAKGNFALNYTTTVSTVVSNSPVAVYQVILSSGASGDFVALFDVATVTSQTAQTTANLKTRCIYGSTSQNTFCTYDPPLQFNNGLIVAGSAAGNNALIVYERGRPIGN